MSEFEKLLEKIQEQKPELTRQDIDDKIKQKMENYLLIKEGESFIGRVLETDLGSDLAVLTTTQSGKPLELKPGCSVKKDGSGVS